MEGAASAVARTEVVIPYRKAIRCIAVLDIVIGFVTLVILSLSVGLGIPARNLVESKSLEVFCVVCLSIFFVLHAIVAIALFIDTNEKKTDFPYDIFKAWFQMSKILILMLIAETFVCHVILNWKPLIFLTLGGIKLFFRGVSFLIVYSSIKIQLDIDCVNPSSLRGSRRCDGEAFESGPLTRPQAPLYENIDPPSYEAAIKNVRSVVPCQMSATSPVPMLKIEVHPI